MLRRLHAHRQWANEQLQQHARGLSDAQLRQPFAIGQGSLWATLTHMYEAEGVWLAVLQGKADASFGDAESLPSLTALGEAWAGQEQRWHAYLAALSPDDLETPVVRINSHGQRRTTPRHDALLHVCTHVHYTAAQAMNMMRALGQSAPDLHLITLSRQQTSSSDGS